MCRSESPTRFTTCIPRPEGITTLRLLGGLGLVNSFVPAIRFFYLCAVGNGSRMLSTLTCWQMAWEVGTGQWCQRSCFVQASSGFRFEFCTLSAGAANGRGLLNPMVVVQGQIFQIVNGAADVDDMLHGWTVVGHENSVMYPGSTTGQSHDNEVCSPYSITWHVDKDCHQVSPASFDMLCKQMKETYGMEDDLYPHGSRMLVDPMYVVKSEFVKPLA